MLSNDKKQPIYGKEHANMAKLEDLGAKVGDQIIIEGTVAFSEVATRVEGDRLARKIERQEKQGFKYPETRPHYALSLVDVAIDPQSQGTPLAIYYGDERAYTNKDGKLAMTLETTSNFPPRIYHEQEDGTAVQIEELPAELAVGQKVKVLIQTFASKKFANMGSSFNALLLPAGEVKYYVNNASAEIEAFGLKASEAAPVAATKPDTNPANNPFGASAPEETAEEPAEETSSNPFANVPNDAKPEEPSGGSVVDNPFA